MAVPTLLDQLRASDVLPSEKLAEVAELPEAANPDPRVLGRVLWERGYLTRYQVNLIAAGRGKELRVGQYLLLERLGEGGMGQVFKARDEKEGRIVALKLVRKEKQSSNGTVRRFFREMEAGGKLDHPNIVAALDAGMADGIHYFAMEFVDGTDLARLVKQNGPLPVAVACDYIRQAALGLAAAHDKGIVHRDIKPSNLLVALPPGHTAPVVKILDMGLARLGEPNEGALHLTRLGQVLGTPDYLSPEQARDARTVDSRADIYSLGCTLYYLLAGRPPFQSGSLSGLLLKHQVDTPPAISRLRRDVPAGLEPLIGRLLAKTPEERPQSAAEVAAALEPFARDAHGKAPSSVTIPRAALVAQPGDLWDADRNGETKSPRLRRARRQHGKGKLWLGLGIGAALGATVLLGMASLYHLADPDPGAEPPGKQATAKNKEKQRERPDHEQEEPVRRPATPGPGRVQPRGAHALLSGHLGRVRALAVQGKQAASGDENGIVLLWDVKQRQPTHHFHTDGPVRSLVLTPDLRLLATAGNRVHIWNLKTGRKEQASSSPGMFLSPDARQALSYERQAGKPLVRLWQVSDGKQHWEVESRSTAEAQVIFDRQARRALILGRGDLLQILDVVGRKRLLDEIPPKASRPISGCWGRTDDEIVLGGNDGTVRVASLEAIHGGRVIGTRQKEGILCLSLAPDGKHLLAAGGERSVHRIDLATGKTGARFDGHRRKVLAVTHLPDGKQAISAGEDGEVWLWDLSRPSAWGDGLAIPAPAPPPVEPAPGPFQGHKGAVHALALSPDGTQLLSGGFDGTVRLWDIRTGKQIHRYPEGDLGVLRCVRFSPDGKRVLAIGSGKFGQVWMTETRKLVGNLYASPPEAGTLAAAEFTHTGNVATAQRASLALGFPDRKAKSYNGVVRLTCLRRLGNSDLLACGDATGTIHLFHTATSPPVKRLSYRPHTGPVRCLDYHPGRMQLLSGGDDGVVASRSMRQLLAGAREEPPRERIVVRQEQGVTGLVFRRDGQHFFSTGLDGTVRLWNVTSGKERHRFTDTEAVHDIVLLHDDRRLITCGPTIRLWQLPEGK